MRRQHAAEFWQGCGGLVRAEPRQCTDRLSGRAIGQQDSQQRSLRPPARVVGLDLDKDVVGVLAEKKASDLILWDSSTRATKGKLGAPDGTKSWIDAIQHCAHRARSIDLNAAKQLLDDNGLANSPIFLTALGAVLEVLPLSARYTGFDPVKAAATAASAFEALENLRRLALEEQVPVPKQLELILAALADGWIKIGANNRQICS